MNEMTSATVFGLDVWSEEPLPYLQGARAPRTGRVLDVLVDHRGYTGWEPGAKLISAQLDRDGTPAIRIEAHPDAGYQLSGPRYGRHVISPDGRRLRLIPEGAAPADWQRFLIGQVLPFAAAVNGLEVFHASAVAFGSRALAIVGPSGAGKTSLALALARAGAVLLADDVLALEPGEDGLLAHPGTPVAGVAHGEAERLGARLADAGAVAVDERERLIPVELAAGPVALRAVLFLERSREGSCEPRLSVVQGTGALLGTTFNFVLDDPARLVRLLDVCALAAHGTLARVSFGAAVDADRLAGCVGAWFESLT
jgi:hypothetical protein